MGCSRKDPYPPPTEEIGNTPPSPDFLYKFKTFLDNPYLPFSGRPKFPLWVGYRSFLERPNVRYDPNIFYSFSDQLVRNYNLNDFTLDVDVQDLRSWDEALCDKLVKQPAEYLPLV